MSSIRNTLGTTFIWARPLGCKVEVECSHNNLSPVTRSALHNILLNTAFPLHFIHIPPTDTRELSEALYETIATSDTPLRLRPLLYVTFTLLLRVYKYTSLDLLRFTDYVGIIIQNMEPRRGLQHWKCTLTTNVKFTLFITTGCTHNYSNQKKPKPKFC